MSAGPLGPSVSGAASGPITPPAVTGKSKLMGALFQAQKSARAIAKDSQNQKHGFSYAAAEAILEESKRVLFENGLMVVSDSWEIIKGEGGQRDRLRIPMQLWHVDGESRVTTVDCYVVPHAGMPEDKAAAAALTYAFGYYLRGLLALSRVEPGDEVDARDDRGYNPQRSQQAQGASRERQTSQTPAGRQNATASKPAGQTSPEWNEFAAAVSDLIASNPDVYPGWEAVWGRTGQLFLSRGFKSPEAVKACRDRELFGQAFNSLTVEQQTF